MQLAQHLPATVSTSKPLVSKVSGLFARLSDDLHRSLVFKKDALLHKTYPLFSPYKSALLRKPPAMAAELLTNVTFEENIRSAYLRGVKCTFTQGDKRQSYDLVLRHSSVATILYHTGMKKMILVKQFRPAVLVGHVLRQPENFNKKLSEIDWTKYDASNGYTLELCAGMIDKKLPVIDIAREEIEEECGYALKNEDIHFVTTFNVAAHESGGVQYLFYAEINDSMKVTEGGGNASEDEYITKVFLTEDEVRALVSNEYPPSPSSMLYALMWWLENKCSKQAHPVTSGSYEWHPKDVIPLANLEFEQMPLSNRFIPLRMHFSIGSLSRSWDLALCHESFAILLYDEDRKELIFTQRFRPAALIGLARHRAPPKTKLESIDWSLQPSEWAYTLELCSGHYERNASKEQIVKQVKECVAHRCGYLINEMDFVTSYLIGISFSGDRQRVYYAKVNSSMKVKDWKPLEDVLPCSIPSDKVQAYLRTPTDVPTRPPAVMLMMQWFLNRQLQRV